MNYHSIFDSDPLIDRYSDWLSSKPFMVRLMPFLFNVALLIYGWSLATSRVTSSTTITNLGEAYVIAFLYLPFAMVLFFGLPVLAIIHSMCLFGDD